MRIPNLAAIAVTALVALGLTACEEGNTIVNTPGSTATGISVSGTGRAFGAPDVVRLQLGVQAEAATVAQAREAAAATAQAVIDSVKRNGVDARDIQTARFDVTPVYETSRTGGTQVIRGYRVMNVLSVSIRKVDSAGKVIDDAAIAGGNNTVIQAISFSIDDPAKLRAAARDDAMAEARAKAEQLAREAGVKAGKPISIVEGGGVIPFETAQTISAPRLAADTSTPIESGQLLITVTVQVLYSIE